MGNPSGWFVSIYCISWRTNLEVLISLPAQQKTDDVSHLSSFKLKIVDVGGGREVSWALKS